MWKRSSRASDALTLTVASSRAECRSGLLTHGTSLSRSSRVPLSTLSFYHPPFLPAPQGALSSPFDRSLPRGRLGKIVFSLRRGIPRRTRTPNLMGETQRIEVWAVLGGNTTSAGPIVTREEEENGPNLERDGRPCRAREEEDVVLECRGNRNERVRQKDPFEAAATTCWSINGSL